MHVTHSTARQRWTALILLAAVEVMILLDTATVNIATPAIKAGLPLPQAGLPRSPNAFLLVFVRFPLLRRRAADVGRLDLAGALSATAAVLLIAYAPISGQQQGWMSVQALGSLGLAVALLLTFIAIEARSPSPLVPLRVFRNRDANGANIVSFLVGAAHAPMFFLLSLYFQQALHYDALTAGLAIVPIAVLSLPAGILLIPRALDHLGARRVLAAGMFLLAVGAALFSRAPIPNNFVFDILPGSVLMALGLPATFVGVNIAALTAVEQTDSGLASGLMNTAQRVGSGIGISALVAVFIARVGAFGVLTNTAALSAGFQLAFLGAAAFALLGSVLTLAIIRQPKHAPQQAPTFAACP